MSQKYVYNPLTCEYDIINLGAPGVPGARGPVGPPGPVGPAGQGVPTGGTVNQVLVKASGTDYDTAWADPSSTAVTLQEVVDAGASVVSSDELTWRYEADAGDPYESSRMGSAMLAVEEFNGVDPNPVRSGYLSTLGGTPYVELNDVESDLQSRLDTTMMYVGTQAGVEGNSTTVNAAAMTLRQENGDRYITLAANTGFPSVYLVDENGYVALSRVADSGNGNLKLPNTTGAEVIATREWVAAQGGATPDLAAVTTEGATTANPMTVTDAGETLTLYPGGLNMTGAAGQVDLGAAMMTLQRTSGDNISLLTGGTAIATGLVNGVGFTLNVSGGGTNVTFPETNSGQETLATQEWAKQNGATIDRPAPVQVGHQYFDTTLGHPIWYDGVQWVDATGTAV